MGVKLYHFFALILWAIYFCLIAFSPAIAVTLYFKENFFSAVGLAAFIGVIFTIFNIYYIYKKGFIVEKIEHHLNLLEEPTK